MEICSSCILSSSFPNISFDENKVCNFCRSYSSEQNKNFKSKQKKVIEETIKKCKGKYEYDALCCYSGGKDSTYMLKVLKKDYHLKILAFTLDNGFIPDKAKKNIDCATSCLNVDHIYFRPAPEALKSLFRSAILGKMLQNDTTKTRISDVCLACITLINTLAARMALQKKIPMVFAGFTAGQIPRAVIKNNYKFYKETLKKLKKNNDDLLCQEAMQYFEITEDDFEVYQISPNMVDEKTESEILNDIRKIGWVYPEGLDGCTSNCALNSLGNIVHEKKFGFHPYDSELSMLIRQKVISRSEALEKVKLIVSQEKMGELLKDLGLSQKDISSLSKQ